MDVHGRKKGVRRRSRRIDPNGWGGEREGAGRPKGPRPAVAHRTRPPLKKDHPVHVTLRARAHFWNLRSRRSFRIVEAALRGVRERSSFGVVHFSVQGNHLHLIVEARDASTLARGMRAVAIRLAKGLNRLMGTRGAVFADRYR